MITLTFDCAKCHQEHVSAPLDLSSGKVSCPHCDAEIRVIPFPALLTDVAQGEAGERLLVDDESSCFYHPSKRAVVACEGCGRFLCSLCDIDMGGQHLCTKCIEAGASKGKMATLQKEHVSYDDIALSVAIAPMLFIWPTLISAPVTLYLVIRHWRTPLSVIPRWRWRFVVAALIATAQLAGWAFVAISMF